MWLQLNINDMPFKLEISGYNERKADEDIEMQIFCYMEYVIDKEISRFELFTYEIEELSRYLNDFLEKESTDENIFETEEYGMLLISHPKKELRLRNITGKLYSFEPEDKYIEWRTYDRYIDNTINNYYAMIWSRDVVEMLLIYIKYIIGEIPFKSSEITRLIDEGKLYYPYKRV